MDEAQYRALIQSDEACLHGIAELKTQIQLLISLVNGNSDQDIPGIRPRLKTVEDRLNTMEREWNDIKQRYNGAKWILGLLGVTNVATFAVVIRYLLGLP